jgi:two-component system cell cycle sensor histidine kinase/response regulator CckA
MGHAGGHSGGGDIPSAPEVWDEQRIDLLGGPLIASANAAGIGLSVVRLSPEPRVVYITDRGVEILGHPRQVIMDRPAASFLTPAERKSRNIEEGAPRHIGPGTRTFETMVLTEDGRQVPIEVSLAPVEFEGRPMVVTFFRDISARWQAMAALERSEARFRSLIELAPDAVWIVNGPSLVFVNPATVRLMGYDTIEEVLALKPLEFVHPEDLGPMRERTMQMLASGQPLPPRDYRVRRRDGAWVPTEVQSMPIEWEGTRAILGIARDVTFRKELEADLMRRERLAALGTLLAGIAHEMNNPLAFVKLGVEHALAGLETLSSRPGGLTDLRDILEDVRQGVERVAGVVRQLRASSRPEVERRGPVDLRQVMQSAIRVVHNEMRHRARLHTELAELPPVDGNAQRLEQVFLNILVNATQALPEGRAGNEISVVLREGPDRDAIVEVTDNGGGIAPEVLPHIFDPFFTTKPVGVGMGLGLSICHGLVTSHGGSIDVDSKAGSTTFRVKLPLRQTPEAAPGQGPVTSPHLAAIRAPAGARRRILVVDDEPSLGEIIRRRMSAEYDVDVVTDARQALVKIGRPDGSPYDLILCDLMMPEMTGMDLHAVVARDHPGVERRFVFMTGGAFTAGASQFLAGVKNQCLEKPFDLEVVKALLGKL